MTASSLQIFFYLDDFAIPEKVTSMRKGSFLFISLGDAC